MKATNLMGGESRNSADKQRKRIGASPMMAKVLREIETAVGSRLPASAKLAKIELGWLQSYICGLLSRLSWALAYSKKAGMIRDTVYIRSVLIDSRFKAGLRMAEVMGDHRRYDQLKALQRKWNTIDKGCFAETETGIEALTLLRKWYAYGLIANRLSRKRRVEFEHQVLEPIIRSLNNVSAGEATELFGAIEKGQGFRQTDENNVDRRLAEIGALARLLGMRNVGLAKTLRKERASDWTGDMRDFQKSLHDALSLGRQENQGGPENKKSGATARQKPLFNSVEPSRN